jgi:predicted RND superfamily exporter protein
VPQLQARFLYPGPVELHPLIYFSLLTGLVVLVALIAYLTLLPLLRVFNPHR